MTERLLLFFLLFIQFPVFAAETEIVGVVYDSESKEVLPYVSVYVKGTKSGTMTDASGNFTLKIDTSVKLLFHFDYSFIFCIFVAVTVFCIKVAIVIGPTPPGTGVM